MPQTSEPSFDPERLADFQRKLNQYQITEARERYEDSLLEFMKGAWSSLENSPYQSCWAIDAVCDHVEAVTLGYIPRLLINIPPRCTKTTLCSIVYPAWTWARSDISFLSGPQVRFLCASYGHTLGLDASNKSRRLLTSPWFQKHWPGRIQFQADQNTKTDYANTAGGARRTTSVGGSLLGLGGDVLICLPYAERVLTDSGWLKIGDVVSEKLTVKIAGLDEQNELCWQNIECYEKNPGGEIVEIKWGGGSLRCTADHRVYVEGKGYIAAKDIQAGDALVGTGGFEYLPEVWEDFSTQAQPPSKVLWQRLLFFDKSARTNVSTKRSFLRSLWKTYISFCCALGTFRLSSIDRAVLRSHLPGGLRNWCEESRLEGGVGKKALRLLRKRLYGKGGLQQETSFKVLFKFLQGTGHLGGKALASTLNSLFRLRETFQAQIQKQNMLFSEMCGQASCATNGGKGERAVRTRELLFNLSRWLDKGLQSCYPRPRWGPVQVVSGAAPLWTQGICGSPYRLSEAQLGPNEPNNSVSCLPWGDARGAKATGGVERKVVQSVTNVGWEGTTYNLRVAPCHNYFAEGVLVHNCDDLNNTEQVESEAERDNVSNFWNEFHTTRLNSPEKSAIICIQQRLHEQDVSGQILDSDEDWVHLCIPMRYDDSRRYVTVRLPQYDSPEPYNDPRTVEGELMWPERFNDKVVTQLEASLGPYLAAGRLQQLPVPKGGGIIQRKWWQLWDGEEAKIYGLEWSGARKEFPHFELVVGSLDTSYGEKQENDFNAFTVWGIWLDRNKNRRAMLMFGWAKRLPLHGTVITALPGEAKVNFEARQREAFGLVEWVADTARRYKMNRLLIEDKTRGRDVAQEINRLYARENWGVQLVNPQGDKVSRTHSIVPLFTDGAIYAPETRWSEAVLSQCQSFPKAAHDDLHDTVTQFLNWARENGVLVRADEMSAALEDEQTYRGTRTSVAAAYGL